MHSYLGVRCGLTQLEKIAAEALFPLMIDNCETFVLIEKLKRKKSFDVIQRHLLEGKTCRPHLDYCALNPLSNNLQTQILQTELHTFPQRTS